MQLYKSPLLSAQDPTLLTAHQAYDQNETRYSSFTLSITIRHFEYLISFTTSLLVSHLIPLQYVKMYNNSWKHST